MKAMRAGFVHNIHDRPVALAPHDRRPAQGSRRTKLNYQL